VSDSKVVPFRRRALSQAELEAYQRMMSHLSPTLRQRLTPVQLERLRGKDPGSQRR